MGLEIYNKPTIKYRIEGFSFFICNAWELMLKAHLINTYGEDIIYYKNDKERSISISEAVAKVYTDVRQPLRRNLEEIIHLRNEATHLVTKDDEILYAPFFQSNVLSFSEQIKRFHDVNITDHISQSFLTLSVDINILTDEEIKKKYSPQTAKAHLERRKHLEKLKEKHNSNDLYIPVRVEFFSTKKKDEADFLYAIDNSSEDKIGYIKQEIDPKDKYNLKRKQVIDGINKQIQARGLEFHYISTNGNMAFNGHTLMLIMDYYNLEEKHVYQFAYVKRYSQQLVTEIVNIIEQNPDVISHIQNKKR